MCGAEVVERVTAHLLNTEGDTFTFHVDRENNCFEFFALLVLANGFFTGFCPGQVGEVNETVDAAFKADENTEVGDGLDLPLTVSPFWCVAANSSQGLGLHCFMPREIRRRSSSIRGP